MKEKGSNIAESSELVHKKISNVLDKLLRYDGGTWETSVEGVVVVQIGSDQCLDLKRGEKVVKKRRDLNVLQEEDFSVGIKMLSRFFW